jgi:flagellar biosynthesis protein
MNQPPKAVALKYDENRDAAPRVAAKGRREVAEKIIDIARQHKIPVYEDPNLIQVLDALDVAAEIPPELYRAVAEVLAFVYRLNETRS